MEGSEFLECILPEEFEQIGAMTVSMRAAWAQYAELRLYDYEEAIQSYPTTAKWISPAQIAARSSHLYILEDGLELPK
jgi:hypothetical protein